MTGSFPGPWHERGRAEELPRAPGVATGPHTLQPVCACFTAAIYIWLQGQPATITLPVTHADRTASSWSNVSLASNPSYDPSYSPMPSDSCFWLCGRPLGLPSPSMPKPLGPRWGTTRAPPSTLGFHGPRLVAPVCMPPPHSPHSRASAAAKATAVPLGSSLRLGCSHGRTGGRPLPLTRACP